jgi:inner membrane protein
MDSLSQIVLGAAMAEAVAGKKLGNRAMVWGAIGGTIPDLDIISNLWMPYIDALAAHRGMSHSIVFAIFFSFFMAWLAKSIYSQSWSRSKPFKWFSLIFGSIFGMLVSAIIVGFVTILIGKVIGILVALPLLYLAVRTIIWQYENFIKADLPELNVDYKTWYWLFFWAIFTHPILDCFTLYGTQLLWPFTDMRIAWNVVSVADPAYTIPFLGFLLLAAYTKNNIKKRTIYNWMGIGYSLLYLSLAAINKQFINAVAEKTIADEGIKANRYMTNASILNNILWTTTIETDSSYYQGLYSPFDKEKKFKLYEIPKNHDLLDGHQDDKTIKILKWFSADYYAILKREDGKIQFNDMRYGTFKGNENGESDYIFKFVLDKNSDEELEVMPSYSGPPRDDNPSTMITDLITRIKGI